jgi:hypothetical protein
LHVAWFAIADPELAGFALGLVVRGAAVWVELLVLVPELHAARPTAQPATRVAAVILAGQAERPLTSGLTRDCLFMRSWSPDPGR